MTPEEAQDFLNEIREKEKSKESKANSLEFNVEWNTPHENKTFFFYRNEDKSITNSKDPSELLSENCDYYKNLEKRVNKHNESLRKKK